MQPRFDAVDPVVQVVVQPRFDAVDPVTSLCT